MLLPKRPLRARTFRLGAGQTIAVGGVARIDVVTAPAATLYLTLWASDEVTTHFGKTEGADERCASPAASPAEKSRSEADLHECCPCHPSERARPALGL